MKSFVTSLVVTFATLAASAAAANSQFVYCEGPMVSQKPGQPPADGNLIANIRVDTYMREASVTIFSQSEAKAISAKKYFLKSQVAHDSSGLRPSVGGLVAVPLEVYRLHLEGAGGERIILEYPFEPKILDRGAIATRVRFPNGPAEFHAVCTSDPR